MSQQMTKAKVFGATCLTFAIVCSGCSNPSSENNSPIKIDGSSTVFPITQKAVEEFKADNPQSADISENISGTGGGFREFCQGQTDINNASRPIKIEEMDLCSENQVSFIELPVAFDALTVVVNSQNTWIDSISTAELKKIWQTSAENSITQWNQVNSQFPDKPLTLFGPDIDSGTFEYFTEAIMGESGASRSDYVSSEDDNVLVKGVQQDPNALGYFGLAYYEANPTNLKALGIDSGQGPVLPTKSNVEKSVYQPLARPLFIYVNLKSAQDNPSLEKFIGFYLDKAGEIAKTVDYIPLTQESYQINKVTFYKGKAGTVFGGKSQFDVTIPELQRKQAQLRIESK